MTAEEIERAICEINVNISVSEAELENCTIDFESESHAREWIKIQKLAVKALENELERVSKTNSKEGKWIKRISGNGWNEWYDLQCNICNTIFKKTERTYNYCPSCGAKMKGD